MQAQRLAHFIWRVALPREFSIVFVVNGVISYFLFWNRSSVPILGWDGLSSMLLPMSFILPWLTSFFGVASYAWTPTVHIESNGSKWPWLAYALQLAFLHSLLMLPIVFVMLNGANYLFMSAQFSGILCVLSIATGSATVAGLFHWRSIVAANRKMQSFLLRP